MKMKNFEEELVQMSKPEFSKLKHQDMLGNSITNAKDKSVLSFWWLSIPLYMIALFIMKNVYMPHATLISSVREITRRDKFSSLFFFLVLPIIFMVLNFMSIRRIYFLSGSPKRLNFLQVVWLNVLMIVLSVIILIIYLL